IGGGRVCVSAGCWNLDWGGRVLEFSLGLGFRVSGFWAYIYIYTSTLGTGTTSISGGILAVRHELTQR
ncbi:MAG: hypothetical protein ACK55I_38920, partial [bacterium]